MSNLKEMVSESQTVVGTPTGGRQDAESPRHCEKEQQTISSETETISNRILVDPPEPSAAILDASTLTGCLPRRVIKAIQEKHKIEQSQLQSVLPVYWIFGGNVQTAASIIYSKLLEHVDKAQVARMVHDLVMEVIEVQLFSEG